MVQSKRNTAVAAPKRSLITYCNPESVISEQFRAIQANIQFLRTEQNDRVFLITSPSSGEGKSVGAANLAVSMAQQKERILLIDANLRTPVQHDIFKIPNEAGLSEVLTGKMKLEEAVYHTEIGRLDLLTSGTLPFNPGELLGSQMMEELLEEALKYYNLVLIDSSGVIEVTDSKLLAQKCDGVILVIQNGKTKLEKAAEAKKELEFSKAKLIGVIMNER